jgi:hypothetical protein
MKQARIGRWLGIARRVGSDMTYWILTEAGHRDRTLYCTTHYRR